MSTLYEKDRIEFGIFAKPKSRILNRRQSNTLKRKLNNFGNTMVQGMDTYFQSEIMKQYLRTNEFYHECLHKRITSKSSFCSIDTNFLRKYKLLFNLQKHYKKLYLIPKPETDAEYKGNFEIAVEREIMNCSRKIIYVDDENKVRRDVEYYKPHFPSTKFFVANESILSDLVGWYFENPRGSSLPYVFQKLLENGIYSQLKWFYERQQYSGARLNFTRSKSVENYEPVKSLDLQSNLQTLFYLFLMGIAICLGVGCIELLVIKIVGIVVSLSLSPISHLHVGYIIGKTLIILFMNKCVDMWTRLIFGLIHLINRY